MDNMNTFEAIITRRSVRKFRDKDVDKDIIGKILEACRWSPSAGNRQPWEVIITEDEETKKEIAKACLHEMWISSAPVILIICVNEDRAEALYGRRGRELYGIQSTAAATQNIMLTAHSEGLGSCWVGAFEEDKLKEILGCPEHIKPVVVLPLGHPKETPEAPRRLDITDFSYFNRFGQKLDRKWKGVKSYLDRFKKKVLS